MDSSSKRSRHEMNGSSSKSAKSLKTEEEEMKSAASGSNLALSEPHEDSMFEMSKKIWGETGSVEKTTEKKKKRKRKNKKKKKKKDERENDVEREEGGGDFWSKYPNIGESIENMKVKFPSLKLEEGGMKSLMKKKVSLIGDEKAKEFDEKWKQLAMEKIEIDYKMLELMKDQLQIALNHY